MGVCVPQGNRNFLLVLKLFSFIKRKFHMWSDELSWSLCPCKMDTLLIDKFLHDAMFWFRSEPNLDTAGGRKQFVKNKFWGLWVSQGFW